MADALQAARGTRRRCSTWPRSGASFVGEHLGAESQEEIVHRTLAYAAKLLTEAGVAVIVDATAPRRVWREAARELIPRFAEVQLVCPAEICVERERGLALGSGAEPRQRGRPGAAAAARHRARLRGVAQPRAASSTPTSMTLVEHGRAACCSSSTGCAGRRPAATSLSLRGDCRCKYESS